jgi:hypothetical protein
MAPLLTSLYTTQYNSTQDEHEPVQLNENILLLQSIWRSEYHAPEILPYQEELVEQIKGQLESQQVGYRRLFISNAYLIMNAFLRNPLTIKSMKQMKMNISQLPYIKWI